MATHPLGFWFETAESAAWTQVQVKLNSFVENPDGTTSIPKPPRYVALKDDQPAKEEK